MTSKTTGVSVSVTYRISGEEGSSCTKSFRSSNPARIGLPEGTLAEKPDAGDYRYSGMHDTGTLIEPREGGDIARLIACVVQAKDYNDTHLTEVIEKEKGDRVKKKAKK